MKLKAGLRPAFFRGRGGRDKRDHRDKRDSRDKRDHRDKRDSRDKGENGGSGGGEEGGLVAGGEGVEVGGEAVDGGVGENPLADEADAALALGMDEGVVGGGEGFEALGGADEEDFAQQAGGIAVEEAGAAVAEDDEVGHAAGEAVI